MVDHDDTCAGTRSRGGGRAMEHDFAQAEEGEFPAIIHPVVFKNREIASILRSRQEKGLHRSPQDWRLNNHALKWFRDTNENPPGIPVVTAQDGVWFHNHDILQIGRLVRGPHGDAWGGTAYEWATEAPTTEAWSWRELFLGMKPAALRSLLGADPDNGVAQFGVVHVGGYDHKRAHAWKMQNRAIPNVPVIWDFILVLGDGSRKRFHTSATNRNVEMALVGHGVVQNPPRSGPGGTRGRGTFIELTRPNYQSRKGSGASLDSRGDAAADLPVDPTFPRGNSEQLGSSSSSSSGMARPPPTQAAAASGVPVVTASVESVPWDGTGDLEEVVTWSIETGEQHVRFVPKASRAASSSAASEAPAVVATASPVVYTGELVKTVTWSIATGEEAVKFVPEAARAASSSAASHVPEPVVTAGQGLVDVIGVKGGKAPPPKPGPPKPAPPKPPPPQPQTAPAEPDPWVKSSVPVVSAAESLTNPPAVTPVLPATRRPLPPAGPPPDVEPESTRARRPKPPSGPPPRPVHLPTVLEDPEEANDPVVTERPVAVAAEASALAGAEAVEPGSPPDLLQVFARIMGRKEQGEWIYQKIGPDTFGGYLGPPPGLGPAAYGSSEPQGAPQQPSELETHQELSDGSTAPVPTPVALIPPPPPPMDEARHDPTTASDESGAMPTRGDGVYVNTAGSTRPSVPFMSVSSLTTAIMREREVAPGSVSDEARGGGAQESAMSDLHSVRAGLNHTEAPWQSGPRAWWDKRPDWAWAEDASWHSEWPESSGSSASFGKGGGQWERR
jgi:hypothetical protein